MPNFAAVLLGVETQEGPPSSWQLEQIEGAGHVRLGDVDGLRALQVVGSHRELLDIPLDNPKCLIYGFQVHDNPRSPHK